MQTRWVAVMGLVLGGCLVDHDLYEARRAALSDQDGDGVTPDGGDCDDSDAARAPGLGERCGDGVDNDCDGRVDGDDDDVDGLIYADADGDGYGDPGAAAAACAAPEGWSSTDDDCDDADASSHPGAEERCDGADNDCDGAIEGEDDVAFSTYFLDGDGDGWGDSDQPARACAPPSDAVAEGGDCDDGDATINPGASETLDGTDEDCSGAVDDLVAERDGVVLEWSASSVLIGSSMVAVDRSSDGNVGHLVLAGPGEPTASSPCAVVVVDVAAPTPLDRAELLLEGVGDSCGDRVASGAGTGLIVVSAPLSDVDEMNGGAVSLFDASSLAMTRRWTSATGNRAGEALAVVGDLDGDGLTEIAVGAPSASDPVRNAGRVWLVGEGAGSGDLADVATATIWHAGADDRFGSSLSGQQDLDGDGYLDLVVGSPELGEGGRADVFLGGVSLPSSSDSAAASLVGEAGAGVGVHVSASDWDGATWWVGAPGANGGRGYLAALPEGLSGTVTLDDALLLVNGAVGDGVGGAFQHLETTNRLALTVRLDGTPAVGLIDLDGIGRTATFADATASVVTTMPGSRLGPVIEAGANLAVGAPTYDGGAGGAVVLFSLY